MSHTSSFPLDSGSLPPRSTFVRWPWILFFLLVTFAFWGARPLADADEGRYAEATRGLIEDGGWLVPMIAGEPHLTKPPMVYWLSAVGMKVFGYNAWGARFFLSVAFFITVIATVELARVWGLEQRRANLVGAVLSTSALPYLCGHILTTDMFLTAAETVGVLCAWKVLTGGSRWWGLAFWLTFAVAFTIKGPPGWMPFLPFLIFWVMRRRGKTTAADGCLFVGGFVLMVSLSFAWFLVLIGRDSSLWQHFVGDEVIARVASDKFKRDNSFLMYFPLLTLGMAPWLFLWPAVFRKAWQRLRQRRLAVLTDVELFSLLWVGTMLTIFIISKSRMPLYVVPLTIPIAFWLGRELTESWISRIRHSRIAWGIGSLWVAGMLAFVLAPESLVPGRTRLSLARDTVAWLEANPHKVDFVVVERSIPFTFFFYSQHDVRRGFVGEKRVQKFLFDERDAGRDVLVVGSKHRIGKICDVNPGLESRIQVIAEDVKYLVFKLAKDAQRPPPKPKTTKPSTPSGTP